MSDNEEKKKGFNLGSLKVDKKKEEGVWAPYEDGLMLKIARAGNPGAKAYAAKLVLKEKAGRIRSTGDDETEVVIERAKKVASIHILVDWKGMLEDDGKGNEVEVPYSSSKAFEYFEEHPEFFTDVVLYSSNLENYKVDAENEVAGN